MQEAALLLSENTSGMAGGYDSYDSLEDKKQKPGTFWFRVFGTP